MSDLKIKASGDRDLIMTRSFNAPPNLVFEALSKPEFIKSWLLGPPGWEMVICEVDFKVGGGYRYVWQHKDGRMMGMRGAYTEIKKNECIVNTEVFDEAWYSGEALITSVMVEDRGRTLYTCTSSYVSKEARDSVLKSNMEHGLEASYSHMDDLLAKLQQGAK